MLEWTHHFLQGSVGIGTQDRDQSVALNWNDELLKEEGSLVVINLTISK